MTQIDKKTKLATAELVMTQLDNLVVQREAFQAEYDKVNDTLFDLLAQCLAIYLTTKGGKAEKEVLDAIKKTFTARGIKIEAYTTVLNLIVRYVFDVSNRRINSYVRVLSYAIQKNETPATFADYVKGFGGIEEVVFTKGVKPETQLKRDIHDAQVLVVEADLSDAQVLATVAPSHLVPHVETAVYTLLIGRTLLSGETEVLAVVPKSSSTMIKQAIDKIADAEIEYQKLQLAQLVAQASNATQVPQVATVTQAPVMQTQVPVAPQVATVTQAPVMQTQVPVAPQVATVTQAPVMQIQVPVAPQVAAVTQAPVMQAATATQVPVAPEVAAVTQVPVMQVPSVAQFVVTPQSELVIQNSVALQTPVTAMDALVIQAEGLTTSVGSVVSANAVMPTINVVSANDITPNLVGIAA